MFTSNKNWFSFNELMQLMALICFITVHSFAMRWVHALFDINQFSSFIYIALYCWFSINSFYLFLLFIFKSFIFKFGLSDSSNQSAKREFIGLSVPIVFINIMFAFITFMLFLAA